MGRFRCGTPVERFWSQMRYEMSWNQARQLATSYCVKECINDPQYVLRTDYDRTLKELETVASKEQVCVIL